MRLRHTHAGQSERFKERVGAWAAKVRVKPTQIRVQKMSRKWASCSTIGWVSFSEDLLRQPGEFQDYVIVHELLHLKVRNHGKLFKGLLNAHLSSGQAAAVARRRAGVPGAINPSKARRSGQSRRGRLETTRQKVDQ